MRQVMVYPGEEGFRVAECPGLPAAAASFRFSFSGKLTVTF